MLAEEQTGRDQEFTAKIGKVRYKRENKASYVHTYNIMSLPNSYLSGKSKHLLPAY